MLKKYPIILAIDTSCDDTSIAVTQGKRVLCNIIASQEELHRKYGGVMPLVAKLEHHKLINPTYEEALKRARLRPQGIDVIAVTYGPGLAIALEVGIEFAKSLSIELKKPLIAINHMAGHMYSSLAVNSTGDPEPFLPPNNTFPIIAFLISGGHTDLVLIKKPAVGSQKLAATLIGQTLDDAAGECLDKFARMLDLGYPGAAALEELAKKGDIHKYSFPLPMTESRNLNFSFSGLKTAGRHAIEKLGNLSAQKTYDLAASFQYAVFRALTYKLKKAIKKYKPKSIWLGGGVINNIALRETIRQLVKRQNISVQLPYSKKLTSDNAAMIGIAAYFKYLEKNYVTSLDKLQRIPRLSL